MKPPSKTMILSMIAVILVFVILAIVLPEREPAPEDCNLVVVNDSSRPIGSVGVTYAMWDGGSGSTAACNADGSPMEAGSTVGFQVKGWPCTVTVYADVEGREALASFSVAEAPTEDTYWQLFLLDKDGGVYLTLP